MFANLIIFIVVLTIYTACPVSGDILLFQENAGYIPLFVLVFAVTTRVRFGILLKTVARINKEHGLAAFDRVMGQQSALAVFFFAAYIYLFSLKSFLSGLPVVNNLPFIGAVIAIGLFILHLIIIWARAHRVYRTLNNSGIPLASYVRQHLMLALPILVPWIIFSGITDILYLAPSKALHNFLDSTWGGLSYFAIIALIIVIFGPALVQKLWGCKPIPAGPARTRMEQMCKKADFTWAELLRWPLFGGNTVTAAVFGLVGRFRYILMTDAMLRVAAPDELDAVLAHEIGHAKKKHMLFFLFIIAAFLPVIYLIISVTDIGLIYLMLRFFSMDPAPYQADMIYLAADSFLLITLIVLYFRFVFGYFMRNFERQADLYVYELMPNAMPLAACLRKIAWLSGRSGDEPNWHHFGINERIQYILKCEADKKYIARHNTKVKKSLIVFAAIIFVVIGALYAFKATGIQENLIAKTGIMAIEQRIRTFPNAPLMNYWLGTIYREHKDYAGAIDAYLREIGNNPQNPYALNDLAWLYAACEDKKYRNPKKALKYAKMAADLANDPCILDTLAESFYVNQMYGQAVAVEEQALATTRPNDPQFRIFQQHLEKYKKASR